MAEKKEKISGRRMRIRYRGRGAQVWICLGKMLRMFVYQNDWKVLPMSALIAGLVGMVVRRRLFISMEGTLMGAFALVCVCIWNGCFNSVQVICRERDVVKREHRSGMHISSYIVAHMLYQGLLCLGQTAVTLYVTRLTGVQYPLEGLFSGLFLVDLGVSMFLITFASDMLSLWVSTIAHTTTTAMTIMPFVLIFQLVFSGGMLDLPPWAEPFTHFTISNPGLKVIAAQADVNNRPFVTISEMVRKMGNSDLTLNITGGQVLDILADTENPLISDLRAQEAGSGITVGEILDSVASQEEIQAYRDETWSYSTTVGTLVDLVGEEEVKTFLEEKAAEASYKAEYERTEKNIRGYWLHLSGFAFLFALLAMITLEFIDKDKR